METKRTISDYMVNIMYSLVGVIALFMESVTSRSLHSVNSWDLKREKKVAFREINKAVTLFWKYHDELEQDMWKATGTMKHFDEMRHEYNYIARMMLLYTDRFSHSPKALSELEAFMRTHGESIGAVNDSYLNDFRLRQD